MVNFYIVIQGRTYEDEKAHGVIWSHVIDKSGQKQHFWELMEEVLQKSFNKIPLFLSRNLAVNHFFLDENGYFSKNSCSLAKIQRNWTILCPQLRIESYENR